LVRRGKKALPLRENISWHEGGAVDSPATAATFALVIAAFAVSGLYAALNGRGLFQDGAYYLYRLAERDWFYLYDPARTSVQVMRQAPVVALLRLGDFSLFHLAQISSLAMLWWPPALTALCWAVAPRGQKIWALVPVVHLLVGFSTTSFEAVGEAAIAASYFWVMLFLIVFRARHWPSQALFLLMCLPAFRMHEAAFLLTPVLGFAVLLRAPETTTTAERVFLGLCGLLLAAIVAYQNRWMLYPRIAGARESALRELLALGFLRFEGRINLPVVTALGGIAALSVMPFLEERKRIKVAVVFAIFALAMVICAMFVDTSFTPAGQSLSRFNPIFASLVLGIFLVLGVHGHGPTAAWVGLPTLTIILALSASQTAVDVVATWRWHQYTEDFRSRLAGARGLAHWRGGVPVSHDMRESNWRAMTVGWVHPIMSIILWRDGIVRSILDYPPDTSFRPIDVSGAERLPKIHGVSYQLVP
jgi:hypothetical protein